MVDPSVIDGTGLYKRFQIRASDGLLQRYLEKVKNTNRSKHRISRQGEMVSYITGTATTRIICISS